MITIQSYEKHKVDSNLAFDFSLDLPGNNFDYNKIPFALIGWIAGKEVAFEKIEAIINDAKKITIPINLQRPDIAEKYPASSNAPNLGFWEYLNPFALPEKFEIVVRAVAPENASMLLCRITGTRTRPDFEMSSKPIVLTTLGRTGSTVTAAMLGCHPEICVYDPFVAEARYATYWSELILRLGDPKSWMCPMVAYDRSSPAWPFGLSNPKPFHYGINPETFNWFNNTYIKDLHNFFLKSLQDHYRKVASIENKTNIAYFCEKFLPDEITEQFLNLVPSAKEIFLVRDFRDMLCSILSFNQKRGFKGFGAERFSSTEEYIESYLKPSADLMVKAWKTRQDTAFLLKYEDLILDPENTLKSVFTYLEIDNSQKTIKRVIKLSKKIKPRSQKAHMTSKNQKKSLAKFHNLDPSLLELCNSCFEIPLKVFGYQN